MLMNEKPVRRRPSLSGIQRAVRQGEGFLIDTGKGMPGLLGIVDPQSRLGREKLDSTLARMCSLLDYGQSLQSDRYCSEQFAIARIHRGDGESFPCHEPERPCSLFLAGELYRLGNRDVLGDPVGLELAHALAEDAPAALASLDGSFALALHDPKRAGLLLANDITSSHPLFVTEHDGVLYFAPEVKALLLVSGQAQPYNEAAIASFLATGLTLFEETFFEKIRQLPPATLLTVDLSSGSHRESQYWRFRFDEKAARRSARHYREELLDLIDRAVRRRIRDRNTKRIAVALSGGYDSRCILGACLEAGAKITTVTQSAGQPRPFSDQVIAEELSASLGLEHESIPLLTDRLNEHLEQMVFISDGLIDQLGNYPEGLAVYQRTAEKADVILRGDELFGWKGGVFHEQDALACFNLIVLPQLYRDMLTDDAFPRLHDETVQGLGKLSSACPNRRLVDRKDWFVFQQGVPNFWGRMNYLKSLVIDVRVPLLDKEILEFMARLPYRHRMYRSLFRETVVAGYPRVFAMNLSRAGNLPDWEQVYRDSPRVRDFIDRILLASSHPIFDSLFDGTKLKRFLGEFRSKAIRAEESSYANAKAFQGMGGLAKLKAFSPRDLLSQSILSNYTLYNLARPFLRKRTLSYKWVGSSSLIMRALTLKIWCDLFLAEGGSGRAPDLPAGGLQHRHP